MTITTALYLACCTALVVSSVGAMDGIWLNEYHTKTSTAGVTTVILRFLDPLFSVDSKDLMFSLFPTVVHTPFDTITQHDVTPGVSSYIKINNQPFYSYLLDVSHTQLGMANGGKSPPLAVYTIKLFDDYNTFNYLFEDGYLFHGINGSDITVPTIWTNTLDAWYRRGNGTLTASSYQAVSSQTNQAPYPTDAFYEFDYDKFHPEQIIHHSREDRGPNPPFVSYYTIENAVGPSTMFIVQLVSNEISIDLPTLKSLGGDCSLFPFKTDDKQAFMLGSTSAYPSNDYTDSRFGIYNFLENEGIDASLMLILGPGDAQKIGNGVFGEYVFNETNGINETTLLSGIVNESVHNGVSFLTGIGLEPGSNAVVWCDGPLQTAECKEYTRNTGAYVNTDFATVLDCLGTETSFSGIEDADVMMCATDYCYGIPAPEYDGPPRGFVFASSIDMTDIATPDLAVGVVLFNDTLQDMFLLDHATMPDDCAQHGLISPSEPAYVNINENSVRGVHKLISQLNAVGIQTGLIDGVTNQSGTSLSFYSGASLTQDGLVKNECSTESIVVNSTHIEAECRPENTTDAFTPIVMRLPEVPSNATDEDDDGGISDIAPVIEDILEATSYRYCDQGNTTTPTIPTTSAHMMTTTSSPVDIGCPGIHAWLNAFYVDQDTGTFRASAIFRCENDSLPEFYCELTPHHSQWSDLDPGIQGDEYTYKQLHIELDAYENQYLAIDCGSALSMDEFEYQVPVSKIPPFSGLLARAGAGSVRDDFAVVRLDGNALFPNAEQHLYASGPSNESDCQVSRMGFITDSVEYAPVLVSEDYIGFHLSSESDTAQCNLFIRDDLQKELFNVSVYPPHPDIHVDADTLDITIGTTDVEGAVVRIVNVGPGWTLEVPIVNAPAAPSPHIVTTQTPPVEPQPSTNGDNVAFRVNHTYEKSGISLWNVVIVMLVSAVTFGLVYVTLRGRMKRV